MRLPASVDSRADDVDDRGHLAEFGRAGHLDLSRYVRGSRRNRIPLDRDGSDRAVCGRQHPDIVREPWLLSNKDRGVDGVLEDLSASLWL